MNRYPRRRPRLIKDGTILLQGVLLLAGNYQSIYKRDLFRLAPPPPPRTAEIKSIVRQPPSPAEYLLLKGVILADGLPSLAVIENRQARTEQVYPDGESIAEVRILKIVKNKVILIDAENKETVLTLVAEAAGALTSSSGTAGLEKSPAKPAPPTVITINPAEAGGPAFNSAYTVSLSEITQNVSASEELKQVRIAPVVNGGKVAGYQVNNLPANSIAFRYGLRNGDVVSRVNGIQLENMSRLAFIYSTIRPGSPVSVEILRKGQPVTLNFNVTP